MHSVWRRNKRRQQPNICCCLPETGPMCDTGGVGHGACAVCEVLSLLVISLQLIVWQTKHSRTNKGDSIGLVGWLVYSECRGKTNEHTIIYCINNK